MPDLKQLLAQKATLEKQISDAQREERSAAISSVKSLMTEHGLTLADLGTRVVAPPRKSSGRKAAVKYRDSASGDAWSGRGLQPKWLRAALASGRKITDFAV